MQHTNPQHDDSPQTLISPTERIELPATVNRYSLDACDGARAVYRTNDTDCRDEHEYGTVHVSAVGAEHVAGCETADSPLTAQSHTPAEALSLTLYRADETDPIRTRTINWGDDAQRSPAEARDALETQLWEWARYPVSERTAAQRTIERLGEPNPHPPGERPGCSTRWYYSFRHETQTVSVPPCASGHRASAYRDKSRYEFKASNADRQWYCGTLTVSFIDTPVGDAEAETDHVYGVYAYLTLYPLKEVDDRVNHHDMKEINRVPLLNLNNTEGVAHDRLLEVLVDGQKTLRDRAEAVGCARRQRIRTEAERRWDTESQEYRDQTRLTGY